MGGFNNPVSGALALIRAAIRSPNYVAGSVGWTINKDGTAEFNSLGGTLQINNLGVFFYIPNAGTGNLRLSISVSDGVDPYGNIYKAGLFINQEQLWATGPHSDTIQVNPIGAIFPTLTFIPTLFNEIARIYARGDTNRLVLQTSMPGGVIEANGAFVATGGLQGVNTAQGSQPPFNVTGSFVDYTSAAWAPLTLTCPPSETIAINTMVWGYNNNTANATLSVSPRVKQGATTLVTPLQGMNGVSILPTGAAATNFVQGFIQYIVGPDVLSGRSGQTLTVIPAWRISAGSTAATCSINTASMSAYPMPFVQPQSG